MMPTTLFCEATDREATVDLFLQLNRHEFVITGDRRTDRGGAEFCVEEMILAAGQGAGARRRSREINRRAAGWACPYERSLMGEAARRDGSVQGDCDRRDASRQGDRPSTARGGRAVDPRSRHDAAEAYCAAGDDAGIDADGRFGFRDYARVMVKDFD